MVICVDDEGVFDKCKARVLYGETECCVCVSCECISKCEKFFPLSIRMYVFEYVHKACVPLQALCFEGLVEE